MKKKLLELSLQLGIYRWMRHANTLLFHRKEHYSERRFYSAIIKPNALVFDVGANRGQSSEIFLLAGARVIAFEPQIKLHREISQRCSHLGQLTIEGIALGDKVEKRDIFLKKFDQVASLRENWQGSVVGKNEIAVSTLDEKIRQYGKPDYCKIDVEGWELFVLKGLTFPINMISIEYHLNNDEISNTKNALEQLSTIADYECNIRECGKSVYSLDHFIAIADFINYFPDDLGIVWQADYGELFIKARKSANQAV